MMDEEIKERDEITAVIIADSFNRTFWPITNDMPKVLMPICNIPLIEYTIELIIRNHIKKIIVFCCSLSAKVLEHIQSQKYRQISIKYISRPSCTSLGGVMRELDNKKTLQNDFIVIYGDTLGNANLKEAIDHHKSLRKENKEYILSLIFSELDVDSKQRTEEEQCVVVLEKSRILQYDGIAFKKNIQFNTNVKFKDPKRLEVRYDLVESGVIICSPEVLHYFSENFDYHSLRDHLMKDILTSDIYNDKFAGYVLPKHHYLYRVLVPRSYDAVSVDIMNRWLSPICLNMNLFPPSTPSSYTSSKNNLYKESKVQLSRTTKIEPPAVIGSGTSIKDDTVISMSTIGRNCVIGPRVKIINSYIWNDVIVGEGCFISNSIVCNSVEIGNNCRINDGSIVSFNVRIKPDVVVPERSRVSLYMYDEAEQCYKISNKDSELGKGHFFDPKLDKGLNETFNEKTICSQSMGGTLYWLDHISEYSQDSDSVSSELEEDGVSIEKFISKDSKN
jgi:translation initiation factor eIF-2B subunit epsilon